MSRLEPNGVKTRGTLTPEEDRKRQQELTEQMIADRERADKETADSHVVLN
jgi:hypothetical protein